MASNPSFWTDAQQASERLVGTYVMYGDSPAYIERIRQADGGRISAAARVYPAKKGEPAPVQTLYLDDERFHRFRKLPPLGWTNVDMFKGAVFLLRAPRRSRLHGLNSEGVSVYVVTNLQISRHGSGSFDIAVTDSAYAASCKGDYPSLQDVLTVLKPESTLAISPEYAVHRDETGLRWLYRNRDRVAIFMGTDSLLLLSQFNFLREELSDSSCITIKDIKEF